MFSRLKRLIGAPEPPPTPPAAPPSKRGVQENKPGHCWSSAASCRQCWYARCNSAGYLQEETLPETKGEKAEPSKQEEPKKKEDEDAEKEKPEEDQKKDEPNA
ncbi:hypothetical protein D4764_17G0008120, partial [Takifugu flavidus]